MARQAINLGSGADSGTGDTIAAAFAKIEANFAELYASGTVITESTTARTLALTDAGCYIRLTNASSCVITVPPQADVAWPDKTEITFRVAGAGIPSITEGSGVTVNDKDSASTLTQHKTWGLMKVADNIWDFV